MNALNIISGLGSSSAGSARSRTSSVSNIHGVQESNYDEDDDRGRPSLAETGSGYAVKHEGDNRSTLDEKQPLLNRDTPKPFETDNVSRSRAWKIPRRIADAIIGSLKFVIATISAPGVYLVACLYDENGSFSTLLPVRKLFNMSSRKKRRKSSTAMMSSQTAPAEDESETENPKPRPKARDIEGETSHTTQANTPELRPAHNTRSKTAAREEVAPAKRSIRIKLHNEAAQKKRHRAQRSIDGSRSEEDHMAAVANALKSPSSPTSVTKLKYPRVPAPPRPLVPRRQPSYTTTISTDTPKKTLIIDLDETLIHSMAKGGRMSTGHMVEVKIQGPIGGNGMVLGPQVPILYYVHERPYCHEFLRKVCKWYNLIVFTASVQEYADPVIDWLERERAYFTGRYYRQHCTFRNGAYIKDLSQVEPDLSKVMILDNSPMSYIFHEDNAIPIEGWISDPTDNDLLHLVPLLEGLQYVTDVRALLALRLGQADRA